MNEAVLFAEDALIGCLLKDNSYIEDVSAEIMYTDFSSGFNREVYMAIMKMNRAERFPIDLITLPFYVKYNDMAEGEIIAFLGDRQKSIFSADNAVEYAKAVKEASDKRRRLILLNEASKLERETSEDSSEMIRRGIEDIENNKTSAIVPYSDVMVEMMDCIDEEANRNGNLTGLSTGFNEIDKLTYGLQKGSLIIIAARPGGGKTTIALNIADEIGCKQQRPVVFFSLEMMAVDLAKRTLSKFTKIRGERIFGGKLTKKDCEDIMMMNPYLSQSKVFINDKSRLSIHDIRSYCRKVKNQFGLEAIFIDYLHLIGGEGESENETLRISHISAELKALAKDFKVPVVAMSQFNRECEKRADKRPMMADLRQSGAIEQDADLILLLHREKLEHESILNEQPVELIIAKNRNGKVGTITLGYNASLFEFVN